MTDSQPDPITRPNSPLDGWPFLAQLHLVNARLEEKPHVREHYSRQFSVTPERQTPESQRTPPIIWPEIDPVEELKEAKEWAANEAKRLSKFYAGRLLLKKEEPERYGIFAENTEYWDSQTEHWKSQYEKLEEVYNRRKQWEAEGKVVKGWAQSLLLSPVQASPPASSSSILPAAAETEDQKPTSPKTSQQPIAKSQSRRLGKESPLLSQLPANAISIPRCLRATRAEREQHSEKKTRKAPRSRRNTSKITKTTIGKAKRQKRIASADAVAPRVLPWKLRSRSTISYHETGTTASLKKKRRPVEGIKV